MAQKNAPKPGESTAPSNENASRQSVDTGAGTTYKDQGQSTSDYNQPYKQESAAGLPLNGRNIVDVLQERRTNA